METLEQWARHPSAAHALTQRARIVLASTTGKDDTVVASEASDSADSRPVAASVHREASGGLA